MFRSMTRRSGSDSGRARARSLEDMRDLRAQPLPKPTKGALKQHPSAKGKGGSADLKRSNARLLPLPSFGPGGIKGSVKRKIYRGIQGKVERKLRQTQHRADVGKLGVSALFLWLFVLVGAGFYSFCKF